ncbi:MAG TPA: hypothetical protein VN328_13085, partial [Thermodesulfovibrionales bacterium]|nr:hypothetical protein [Thermodesulfovibrionales bacterium]
MKRFVVASIIVLFALTALSFAAGKANMELKAGDEIYVCNCGEACKCDTMSRKEGKCTCGKDMVKAKVTKVEAGKAMLKAEKWEKERTFK